MTLTADQIREGRSYRMKDGKVWRVVDFAHFNGSRCVQLQSVSGKDVLFWKLMSVFLDEVSEPI